MSSLWLLKVAKLRLLIIPCLLILISCGDQNNEDFQFQEGDIILQALNSTQCEAVRAATNSYYSHCGIVLKDHDELVVYEAIGPVMKTSISDFTASGINGHYAVLRTKSVDNALNTEDARNYCNGELGKPYDGYFNWGDEEIYCSELVWKAYEKGGVELCELRPLKDYNLSSPIVKEVMQQRYGNSIPSNEMMIAPGDFKTASILEVVYENSK